MALRFIVLQPVDQDTTEMAERRIAQMYNGLDVTRFNNNLKKIDVIVSVNKAGELLPMYFAYEGKTFRISRVASSETNGLPFFRYNCEVSSKEQIQKISLVYNNVANIWMVDLAKSGSRA